MKKQVLAALLLMILFTSFSYAYEDGWVPRMSNYETSWMDQLRFSWQYLWKFLGAF